MSEYYLHIWGKNYQLTSVVKNRILHAAAGENHVLFTNGMSLVTQLITRPMVLAPIDSGNSA
jgi:hypothetical protein